MTQHPKPKVAFFDFASCEGCQIELLNMGESAFIDLLNSVEIVEFREVMKEKTTLPLDISFIEGSFTREDDRDRLLQIRQRSRYVVAYGACAATGGINALKNHQADYADFVYKEHADDPQLKSQEAAPISSVIKVDFQILGCPIDTKEFMRTVSDLIHDKLPATYHTPVCVECKLRETICRYQLGDHCLGLVARGGCGAPCPADGIPCEACRGLVDHANLSSLFDVLVEKGRLTHERAAGKTELFTACQKGMKL
jgi:coenzyme F420-reducing hydrogenase gamma subunit